MHLKPYLAWLQTTSSISMPAPLMLEALFSPPQMYVFTGPSFSRHYSEKLEPLKVLSKKT